MFWILTKNVKQRTYSFTFTCHLITQPSVLTATYCVKLRLTLSLSLSLSLLLSTPDLKLICFYCFLLTARLTCSGSASAAALRHYGAL